MTITSVIVYHPLSTKSKSKDHHRIHAIKIYHDNAKPYIHKDVSTYFESGGIMIMSQLPNFPDLAPCDFWLLDLIKQNLTDQRDLESLHRAVTKIMLSINKDDYKKNF